MSLGGRGLLGGSASELPSISSSPPPHSSTLGSMGANGAANVTPSKTPPGGGGVDTTPFGEDLLNGAGGELHSILDEDFYSF